MHWIAVSFLLKDYISEVAYGVDYFCVKIKSVFAQDRDFVANSWFEKCRSALPSSERILELWNLFEAKYDTTSTYIYNVNILRITEINTSERFMLLTRLLHELKFI